ncbi:hypothetical protein PISMIDRAFT_540746 [Pisolithus microcarpus 441]|uniref:Uncharacterized protein n=1 Tax=Pisolithus microcarpus 441 TaxID=765257 RepID=A0A0C9YXQ7_9AGAM|nr:hypothetical protein PISMIDRAFT_540746 [Pisolithus microcarpus 441]
MSVSETLLRMLARFPKLLIAIVKRCSSTTLRLLQYMFSFRNASVLQSRERKHLGNVENSSPSTPPSNDEEKGREVETGAGVSSAATILCSPDRGPGPSGTALSTDPVGGEGLRGRMPRTFSCDPPLRKPMPLLDRLAGLFSMLTTLDHPGFIGRSLKATQDKGKRNGHRETNVERWVVFSDTFQKDVENVNLLATVLLTANFSFLAIQSIDGQGLSYLPQKLSYTSLLSAMGSILMGLAVRTPRFFTAHSSSYFQIMTLVLGFPFELFLYRCVRNVLLDIAFVTSSCCSVFFFIAALVAHFVIHTAKFQYGAAIFIFSLVFACLGTYWLVTEPREEELCSWKVAASRDVEAAVVN